MGIFKWLFGRKKQQEIQPERVNEPLRPQQQFVITQKPTPAAPPPQTSNKRHNMSLNKYEVKAVYKQTNRSRKLTVYGKNEADVRSQLQDYKEPDSIVEKPYDPPSESQIRFANELHIRIPSACCKEDMTALISEALRRQDVESDGKPWRRVPVPYELGRFADSKHLPYSLYSEEFLVIRNCYMLQLKNDTDRVAFLIACMHKHLRGNWNFRKWDQWLKDAEALLSDSSFCRSLDSNTRFDDGFQGFDYHDTFSSKTKVYKMLAEKV